MPRGAGSCGPRLSCCPPCLFPRARPPLCPLNSIPPNPTGNYAPPPPIGQSVRVLDWNIDRGVRLDEIAKGIAAEKPALCLFQEVDAARSGRVDVATLARRRRMNLRVRRARTLVVYNLHLESRGAGSDHYALRSVLDLR